MTSTQLDRIEKKLDQLLNLLSNNTDNSLNDTPKPVKPVASSSTTKKIIIKNKSEPASKSSSNVSAKKGTVVVEVYSDILLILGETYDQRETIKQFGGKWNLEHKAWTIPNSKFSQIQPVFRDCFNNVDYITKNMALSDSNSNSNSNSKSFTSTNNNSYSSNNNRCDILSDSDDDY